MIKTIEILIRSGPLEKYNALIIYEKNILYLNDRKYNIDENYLKELISIIYLWKEEYGNNNVIDAEEFKVTVTATDKTKSFHGKGIFPNNYNNLKELLDRAHD